MNRNFQEMRRKSTQAKEADYAEAEEVEGGEVRVHEKYDFSEEAYMLVYGKREGGMVKVDVEREVI